MSGPDLFLAAYLLIPVAAAVIALFVFVFWGQALLERARRRRAAQTAEQVWRELLAGRVRAIPTLMFVAAWTAGFGMLWDTPPAYGPLPFSSSLLTAGIVALWAGSETLEVSRALVGGWANVQETRLAQRAHRLVAEATAWAASRSDSGAAPC